jgi:hypothetical protein
MEMEVIKSKFMLLSSQVSLEKNLTVFCASVKHDLEFSLSFIFKFRLKTCVLQMCIHENESRKAVHINQKCFCEAVIKVYEADKPNLL